ncbi:hypothetical protein ElyMa_004060300 [Elysia marginata]|uniref:Uncharacterized protein n=1 Tax=Elysia marginata TaxID=1093978 RepID=A0AAV4G6G9_9GAST|nr:hypothetical protein ElyMa_004060300 [Elysia marginata]
MLANRKTKNVQPLDEAVGVHFANYQCKHAGEVRRTGKGIWESFPPHTEQLLNHELLLAHSLWASWASQGLIAPWESLGLVARWALSSQSHAGIPLGRLFGKSEAGIPLARMTLGKRGASENMNAMAR